jgi:hypothetical protein
VKFGQNPLTGSGGRGARVDFLHCAGDDNGFSISLLTKSYKVIVVEKILEWMLNNFRSEKSEIASELRKLI